MTHRPQHHWEVIEHYRSKVRFWQSMAWVIGSVALAGWLLLLYFLATDLL